MSELLSQSRSVTGVRSPLWTVNVTHLLLRPTSSRFSVFICLESPLWFLLASYLFLSTCKFCGTISPTITSNIKFEWRSWSRTAKHPSWTFSDNIYSTCNTYFLFSANPTRARLLSISITFIGFLGRYGDGILEWVLYFFAYWQVKSRPDAKTSNTTSSSLWRFVTFCFWMNMILVTLL